MASFILKDVQLQYVAILFTAMTLDKMIFFGESSYVPTVLEYFKTDDKNVGMYVGLIAGLNYLARSLGSLFGTYVITKCGTKKSFKLLNYFLILAVFSYSLSWNRNSFVFNRVVVAFFSCVSLCVKVIAYQNATEENQSYLLVWLVTCPASLGSTLGPSLTGFLVLPTEQYPSVFRNVSLMEYFPILLPNLLLDVILLTVNFMICFIPSNKNGDIIISDNNVTEENDYEVRSNTDTKKGLFDNQRCQVAPCNQHLGKVCSRCNAKVYDNDPASQSKPNIACGVIEKHSQFILSCFIMILTSIGSSAITVLLPLWLETSTLYSGMELQPKTVSLVFLVAGLLAFSVEFSYVGYVNKKLGAKKAYLLWNMVSLFVIPLMVYSQKLKGQSDSSGSLVIAFITLFFMVDHVCNTGSTVSANLFVKDSVTADQYPVAVCISELTLRLTKGAFMPLIGWSFSWSLGNSGEYGFGFPFNQCFAFLVLSLIDLICIVTVSFMKPK